MITLYANGGLGNQLFNYAAARTLADRKKTSLIIDAVSYRHQWSPDAGRQHLLHRFPVRANFRNLEPEGPKKPLISRVARRLREDAFTTIVNRGADEVGFFQDFLQLGSRTILKGHFISPSFFAGNEQRIRQDLNLGVEILEPDSKALETLAALDGIEKSIGVHVRRGDLLKPEFRSRLLSNMVLYYRRAFSQFILALGNPVFWVFSDDPEWCRSNLCDFDADIRVIDRLSDREDDPIKDFFLMSRCHSFIIANSAFSWWSAWLGSRPGKHVVAPSKWENHENGWDSDLIPAGWERVSW